MRWDQVIIKPIMTEGSTKEMDRSTFVFRVHPKASKLDIWQAVEKTTGNKVESVRTLNVLGKKKRLPKSRQQIALPSWKKAYVRIVKENTKKLPDVKSKLPDVKSKLPRRKVKKEAK